LEVVTCPNLKNTRITKGWDEGLGVAWRMLMAEVWNGR
jgi:hypothetical protein